MCRLITVSILIVFCCTYNFCYSNDSLILDSLLKRGIITEEESQYLKKSSVTTVEYPKRAEKVKLIQFWHIRYHHFVQKYDDSPSYTKDKFAFRRLVPVVIANFSDSTRIMASLCLPTSKVINTVRLEHNIETDYLRGTAWFAQDAVFFCMEEPESGMRLMTPDRSIINMYFGGADDECWSGQTKAFASNVPFSGYHTGLYWLGKFLENESLVYRIQVVNSNHDKTSFFENNGIACFASIGVDKKEDDIHLRCGINGGYSSKVVGAIDTLVLPSRTVDFGDCFGINPYFWLKYEAITFNTEFVATHIKYGKTRNDEISLFTTKSPDATPWGLYALFGYKFDIKPFGEIEPIFRYTYLNSDGRGIYESGVLFMADSNGGLYNTVQSFYGGVNWYVLGNSIKYQLGMEYAQFRDAPYKNNNRKSDVLVFTLQLQLVF